MYTIYTSFIQKHYMFTAIRNSVELDMHQVRSSLEKATQSNIQLVNTIGQYALNQPGRKLIRPMILLLLAQALGYEGKQHIQLATIIELIHSATLLHDDVIDHAHTRRNQLTTHHVYGGTQSILMGDFIYASAFKLISALKNHDITNILSLATQEIVEGELLQLSLQHKIDTSLDDYMAIIRAKTALLFSTGTRCIKHISNVSQSEQSLNDYGYHFGMLYQITDDILDIDVDNQALNKAHGTDLSEGKMTLSSILAYQNATKKDQGIIRAVVQGTVPWQKIIPVLDRTDALNRCQPYMDSHIQKGIDALSSLPESIYKSHLINLLKHIPLRKT